MKYIFKRKKNLTTGYIALSLIAVSTAMYAQDTAKAESTKVLGYAEYIKAIEKSLPEIKSNNIDVLNAENSINLAKSSGDISLKGRGTHSSAYTETMSADLNNNALYMVPYKTYESDFLIGAEKKIISTGTDISTSLGYTRNEFDIYSQTVRIYTPSVSLKITQPLLYNFLGKVDKFAEKDASIKAEITRLQRTENNKSVLTAYKKLYFQWQLYIKILSDKKSSIKNSEILKEQIAKNLRSGISENDDYQRTCASVLVYQREYQEYLTYLKNIEHQLSLYIDTRNSVPDKNDFAVYVSIASNNAYDYVDFDKTRSYKIIDLSLKNLDYAKGVYENKLLPSLNMFAGVTQKNLSDSSTESFSSLPDRDYNIGMEFTYRLGNNAAESDLEKIKIQKQSLRYEYDTAHNTYRKNLMKLQEYASGTRDQIKTIDDILLALRQQFLTERRKYSWGRLNLSYIIETQNKISSYNTSLLSLKYQLIALYIDYIDAVN